MITIRELPSGFWAVFVNGFLFDASLASREKAEEVAQLFQKGKK